MGCCEGSCSCGKGNKSTAQENFTLVQMPTTQGMLSTTEWMKGLNSLSVKEEVVEIRFKNNRKGFYRNTRGLRLQKDDRIVVEAEGGHDIGTISLTGDRADKRFEQILAGTSKNQMKQIYRKATFVDIEKWLASKRRERNVLLEARRLAGELKLKMSISDAEFQGDGKEVTLYYTADGRIDFRELTRKFAAQFRARIKMEQIGVRTKSVNLTSSNSSSREVQTIHN